MSKACEQMGGRIVVGIKPGTRRLLKRRFWKYIRRAFRRDIERDTESTNVKYRAGWYD